MLGDALNGINEAFEESRAGSILKDVGGFLVGFATDTAWVSAVKNLGSAHALFYAGEAGVEALHGALEFLHGGKTAVDAVKEGIGAIGGYMNFGSKKGAYPVMSMVVRGNFDTQLLNVSKADERNGDQAAAPVPEFRTRAMPGTEAPDLGAGYASVGDNPALPANLSWASSTSFVDSAVETCFRVDTGVRRPRCSRDSRWFCSVTARSGAPKTVVSPLGRAFDRRRSAADARSAHHSRCGGDHVWLGREVDFDPQAAFLLGV